MAVVLIGLRFARRQQSNEDYFVGGRRMNWTAIGISLFATAFSSLSFVGLPREGAYADYHLYLAILLIPLWVVPVVAWVFIPIYHRMRLTSAYKYLEWRFGRIHQLLGSFLYTLYNLAWMGSLLYAVGMIVQVVLGLNESELRWAIVLMGLFTTLYTVVGGFEAVIWTDVLQALTLGFGMSIVLFLALGHVEGGLAGVWALGAQYDKFQMFNMQLNRPDGGTFFSAVALALFAYLGIYATEQTIVQRYVAMPSVSAARRALALGILMSLLICSLFFTVGSTIFAFYHQNVPPGAAAGSGFPELARQDQLLPYFIKNEIQLAGLLGLLLAGLFAAAMSSMDSGINSLTALVVSDWLPGRELGLGLTRVCCAGFGVLVTIAALLVPYLGENVYEIIIKIMGTMGGPLLGIFLLGMLNRRANAPGALAGLAAGIGMSLLVALAQPFSHWWYAAATSLTTVGAGTVVSAFFPAPPAQQVKGLVLGQGCELLRDVDGEV